MCTVSWLHRPRGYDLFCNRDEKRTRAVAAPPRVSEAGGVRWIAPSDPDGSGTWIAVNDDGLAVCLLNGRAGTFGVRSRGLLIPDLIWARCVDDAAFLLGRTDLSVYAPFTLLLIEPDAPPQVANWDGACLAWQPEPLSPITSSSVDADRARGERLREFARFDVSTPAALRRFHASHGAAPGPFSTCMHRDDAETVSFSWISVTRNEVRFEYIPGAPCRALAA